MGELIPAAASEARNYFSFCSHWGLANPRKAGFGRSASILLMGCAAGPAHHASFSIRPSIQLLWETWLRNEEGEIFYFLFLLERIFKSFLRD